MTYVKPSEFLSKNGIKVEKGAVLDPAKLGMPPHPRFGPLPKVEVTAAREDGKGFLTAEMKCVGCGEVMEVHAGDWFQKRTCPACKKGSRKAVKVEAAPPAKETVKGKARKGPAKERAKAKRSR
jgi:hypothetical protein